ISHPVFNLGEGLFDRIKVRRIGWQEPEPRTGCFDQLSDGCRFVAAEIIHDDNVAWLEHRPQLLLDIGAEALAVHRSVEDTGAVSRSFLKAPRNVSVRQWPCGANARSRLPFGPQPLIG